MTSPAEHAATVPEGFPVGQHECKTCPRCATTFAAVHPACPKCALAARADELERERDDLYESQEAEVERAGAAEQRAERAEAALRAVRDYEWHPGQPAVDVRAIARAALGEQPA